MSCDKGARHPGRYREAVTEALSLLDIPEELREQCRRADIRARSVLLQIARLKNLEAMRSDVMVVRHRL